LRVPWTASLFLARFACAIAQEDCADAAILQAPALRAAIAPRDLRCHDAGVAFRDARGLARTDLRDGRRIGAAVKLASAFASGEAFVFALRFRRAESTPTLQRRIVHRSSAAGSSPS
jgi:hypothetical protein